MALNLEPDRPVERKSVLIGRPGMTAHRVVVLGDPCHEASAESPTTKLRINRQKQDIPIETHCRKPNYIAVSQQDMNTGPLIRVSEKPPPLFENPFGVADPLFELPGSIKVRVVPWLDDHPLDVDAHYHSTNGVSGIIPPPARWTKHPNGARSVS